MTTEATASAGAHRPVFALALGGGAALGYSHLGVLEVLEEEGLRPDLVLGASMGSIVGGLYCAGLPLDEIAAQAEGLGILQLIDWQLGGLGIFEWGRVRRRLEPLVGDLRLEDCPTPLVCVTTDLRSGERVPLRRGPLLDAMLASATIPGLYEPVSWEGRLLVDGGLVDEVPVFSAREAGADIVVAVDVSHPLLAEELRGPVDVMRQAYFIIQMHNVDLRGLDFQKFDEVETARQVGRAAARQALPALRECLRAKGWRPR